MNFEIQCLSDSLLTKSRIDDVKLQPYQNNWEDLL